MTELQESRFQAVIEKSSDVVLLCRGDSRIEYVSAAIAGLLGYQPHELVGTNLKALLHPDEQQVFEPAWTCMLAEPGGATTIQWRARQRNGSWKWLESNARNLLLDPVVKAIICNLRDVSGRKDAYELVARLAAIVESSNDAINSADLAGRITSWNHGAERLYRWPVADALAKEHATLIPPQIRDFEEGILLRLLDGEVVQPYESQRLRKDGTMVDVALTVSSTRDASGKVSGVARIARDLTELRKAQACARHAEEQVRQAQKVDAVAALCGGVAHDFNNLLSVILTYTVLVIEELPEDDSKRVDLEQVREAALRAAELTHQILALGRNQVLQAQPLDLTQVALGMEPTLRRVVSEDIVLAMRPGPTPVGAFVDSSQIEQIIMNLVVNACEAMPRAGTLTIETANLDLDANTARTLDIAPGSYATLAVTDTGRGMDEGVLARIYEPFFTTKEKSERTGFGLSSVFGIVKQSHGHIGVWSTPGQGTTFRIYFPRMEPELNVLSAQATPTSLKGSETILLVEDEQQVRLAMGAILRRNGYEALDAKNGGEALLICEQFAGPIHLLLTDVVMPRMSGRELADRLAALRPDMRVLYTSGHTEGSIVHHGVLDSCIAFLAKPIVPQALLSKVRGVLDAKTSEPRA